MSKKKDEKIEKKIEAPKIIRKYFYACGGRKNAKATVHLYGKGSGEMKVNSKDYKEYFPYFEFQKILEAPLELVGERQKVDISARVNGGGKRGQAEAIRHGIALALDKYNVDFHTALKKEGLFTRDRRIKERKKPGLKRARRAPQWAKR